MLHRNRYSFSRAVALFLIGVGCVSAQDTKPAPVIPDSVLRDRWRIIAMNLSYAKQIADLTARQEATKKDYEQIMAAAKKACGGEIDESKDEISCAVKAAPVKEK